MLAASRSKEKSSADRELNSANSGEETDSPLQTTESYSIF